MYFQEESSAVNESEQKLEKNLRQLQYDLSTDEFEENGDEEIPDVKNFDLGTKLHTDAVKRCEGMLELPA